MDALPSFSQSCFSLQSGNVQSLNNLGLRRGKVNQAPVGPGLMLVLGSSPLPSGASSASLSFSLSLSLSRFPIPASRDRAALMTALSRYTARYIRIERDTEP